MSDFSAVHLLGKFCIWNSFGIILNPDRSIFPLGGPGDPPPFIYSLPGPAREAVPDRLHSLPYDEHRSSKNMRLYT